jgi:uncharacterized membrane protein YqjE
MPEESPAQPGLLASSRRVAQLALQTLHTRIELFSIELREEAQRGMQVMILLSAFIFLAAIALLLVSFTVIFSVWDDPQQRIVALWVVSGCYVLGAAVSGGLAWKMVHAARLPFADTLREFEKDREWVRNAAPRKEGQ